MSSAVISIGGLRRIVWGSQLRVNMVAGMAASCATAIIVAYSYRLYLQQLGYELYGLWFLLATALTLVQLGSLGLSPALAKLIAEDKERGDAEAITAHIKTAMATIAASGLLLLAACLFFRPTIVGHLHLAPANAQIAYQLLPYMVAVSVYAVMVDALNAALAGFGRVDLQHYSVTGMHLVGTLVSMVLLAGGYQLIALLIGQVVAYAVMHLATLVILNREFNARGLWRPAWNRASFWRLTSVGWGPSGSALIQMLLSPLNRYLLTRFADVSLIPIYELSLNATMRFRSVAESGVRAIMPEISRLSVARGFDGAKRIGQLHRRTLFLLLTLGGAAYLALFIVAPPLLKVWLGSAYVPELSMGFRTALVGTFLSLLGVPAYYVLLGLGRAKPLLIEKALHCGTSAVLAVGLAWGSASYFSPVTLLIGGALGMGLSTAYLLKESRSVMQSLPTDGA